MLPRYRRLVETLAQRGLLRVICGTDTLGVGINVPIRTVMITALSKFDGTKMRQLTAREFHQVAGVRAAPVRPYGNVVVMAPEWEIENAVALAKAGDDPAKRKKIVRKKAPTGVVNWGEGSASVSSPHRRSPRAAAEADGRDDDQRHRPGRRRVRQRPRSCSTTTSRALGGTRSRAARSRSSAPSWMPGSSRSSATRKGPR
jgi:hypothetical protein